MEGVAGFQCDLEVVQTGLRERLDVEGEDKKQIKDKFLVSSFSNMLTNIPET